MAINLLDKAAFDEFESKLSSGESLLLFGKYSHRNDFVYLLLFTAMIAIAFVIIHFRVNILADPTLPVLIVIFAAMIYFRYQAIEKRPYFAVTTERVLSYGYVKLVALAEKRDDFEYSVSGNCVRVKLKDSHLKFCILKNLEENISKERV